MTLRIPHICTNLLPLKHYCMKKLNWCYDHIQQNYIADMPHIDNVNCHMSYSHHNVILPYYTAQDNRLKRAFGSSSSLLNVTASLLSRSTNVILVISFSFHVRVALIQPFCNTVYVIKQAKHIRWSPIMHNYPTDNNNYTIRESIVVLWDVILHAVAYNLTTHSTTALISLRRRYSILDRLMTVCYWLLLSLAASIRCYV